jgi:Uma2 family endonuclease
VASPCSRLIDLHTKRAAYAEMGVPGYWVVDPAAATLTVLELDADGGHRVAVRAEADTPVDVRAPFPVRFAPADLLR